MLETKSSILILGGGFTGLFTGLFTALHLSHQHCSLPIVTIDRE
ncbi:MAG: hypothetical protein CLLPBCKN_002261 [Chroococcidiopsis cubana SAG 39.79]|nr:MULTISPECIES: hypothetical protein [Chroococcidiopsis]MDZ4872865.1 hypothetical protein [Chroococcidiopsis cubana SAG 39.79]